MKLLIVALLAVLALVHSEGVYKDLTPSSSDDFTTSYQIVKDLTTSQLLKFRVKNPAIGSMNITFTEIEHCTLNYIVKSNPDSQLPTASGRCSQMNQKDNITHCGFFVGSLVDGYYYFDLNVTSTTTGPMHFKMDASFKANEFMAVIPEPVGKTHKSRHHGLSAGGIAAIVIASVCCCACCCCCLRRRCRKSGGACRWSCKQTTTTTPVTKNGYELLNQNAEDTTPVTQQQPQPIPMQYMPQYAQPQQPYYVMMPTQNGQQQMFMVVPQMPVPVAPQQPVEIHEDQVSSDEQLARALQAQLNSEQ